MNSSVQKRTPYRVASAVIMALLAVFFVFPLYWIFTGSVKTAAAINAPAPQWFPLEPTLANYNKLFSNPALLWLFNTIFIAVVAMGITCLTSAMAGYVLAKKRFYGRALLFTLIVCAMALPKQVILIPLLREMSALKLHDTLWAVILPTVGWPFGVFLMKQFSEGIPGHRRVGHFYLYHGLERLLYAADHAQQQYQADHLAGPGSAAGRNGHRFRADHGGRFGGGDSDPDGVYLLPEIFYPGHHYGRGQGINARPADKEEDCQ